MIEIVLLALAWGIFWNVLVWMYSAPVPYSVSPVPCERKGYEIEEPKIGTIGYMILLFLIYKGFRYALG